MFAFESEKNNFKYNKIVNHLLLDAYESGFGETYKDLNDLIINPLRNKNLIPTGLKSFKNIILHGPIGSGKTSLIKALIKDSGFDFVWLDLFKFILENEKLLSSLKRLFHQIKENSAMNPTIIIIENIDNYFGSKNKITSGVSVFCDALLEELKIIQEWPNVCTIATVCELSELETIVWKNCVFDIDIELPTPTELQRYEIIKNLFGLTATLTDDDFKKIAAQTRGFLPVDLVTLSKHSVTKLMRDFYLAKNINENSMDGKLLSSSLEKEIFPRDEDNLTLSLNDVTSSVRKVSPSLIRKYTTDVPKIKWSDIGGMEDVKQSLKECVIWPMTYPDKLKQMGIRPSGGVLLFGPSGCSKTMMARALAGESNMNFISIKGPELLNKYVGETEKQIRDLFVKARLASPCVLFFDEVDAITSKRSEKGSSTVGDKYLAQLLTEMDGISGSNINLFIVGATNRPYSIDTAIVRPGRFDRLVYVPLPDSGSRRDIFKLHLKDSPIHESVDIEQLVKLTHHYTGAEIAAVCKEAAYTALRNNFDADCVKMSDFEFVLTKFKPRTDYNNIQMYENFKDSVS